MEDEVEDKGGKREGLGGNMAKSSGAQTSTIKNPMEKVASVEGRVARRRDEEEAAEVSWEIRVRKKLIPNMNTIGAITTSKSSEFISGDSVVSSVLPRA